MALGDYYVNPALGLELHKPPGWHFLSAREWARLQRVQAMHMPDTRSYLEFLHLGGPPFLAVTTQSEYVPTMEPVVGFQAFSPDPSDPIGPVEQFQAAAEMLEDLFDDFTLDECGTCKFLGYPSAQMIYRYSMWIDSTKHRVQGRSLNVRTPRLELSIDFGWPEGEPSESDLAIVEDSIRIL